MLLYYSCSLKPTSTTSASEIEMTGRTSESI